MSLHMDKESSRLLELLGFGLLTWTVVIVVAGKDKSEEGPLSPKAFAHELVQMCSSGQLKGFNDMANVLKLTNIGQVIESFIKNGTLGKPVRFFIFNNPKNPLSNEELPMGDLNALRKSGYDSSRPTKIFLHPWLGIPFIPPLIFPYSAIYSYLLVHKNAYNLILIDYTKTTGYPIYPVAAIVGLKQAINDGSEFITWLHNEKMIDLSQTHIIGLGLGAHVGGGIASNVNKTVKVAIRRLTGLDPTGPLFKPKLPLFTPPHVIGPEDAQYVDTGRTNALIAGLGMMSDVGKTDYYLNGGIMQPGCSHLVKLEIVPIAGIPLPPGTGLLLSTICSHLIAGEFYSFSIWKKNAEKRCACNSHVKYKLNPLCCSEKSIFGDHNDLSAKGTLYMDYNPILS